MSAENLPKKNLVVINNVPANFRLKDAKTFLQEILNNNNPTQKVAYARNPDNSVKKNTIIVELTSAEFVETLLSKREIDVENEDELYTLNFAEAACSEGTSNSFLTNLENPTSSEENSDLQKHFSVQHFEYLPEIDCDKIHFVSKSQGYIKQLGTELQDLAKVNFRHIRSGSRHTSNVVVEFWPVNDKCLRENCQNNQEEFESECIQNLIHFFAEFSSENTRFYPKKLKGIRETYAWNASDDIIKVKIDESDVHFVYVRWNDTEDGSTKIVGLSYDVTVVLNWLKAQCNYSNEQEQYCQEDFEILEKCNVFEDIIQQFSGRVDVEVNKIAFKVTFQGIFDDVSEARMEMKHRFQRIGRCRLTNLNEYQLKFLEEELQNEEGIDDVFGIISSCLYEEKIAAMVCTRPELGLIYNQQNDKIQAETLLNRLIQTRDIPVENGLEEFVLIPQWHEMRQNLGFKNIRVFLNVQNSSLTVVGLSASIDTTYKEVRRFVSENIPEERIVNVSYPFALFLKEFAKELDTNVGFEAISWDMTSQSGGGMFLRGKNTQVEKVEAWLHENKECLIDSLKCIKQPGMAKYFQAKTGKEFLKTTQTVTKCIILTDAEKSIEWNSVQIEQPAIFQNFNESTLPNEKLPLHQSTTTSIPIDGTIDTVDEIQLYLCSNHKQNIDQALKKIAQHVKEKSLRKILKDEILCNVSNAEEEELMTLENEYNVFVRRCNTNRPNALAISGLTENVIDAYTAATKILQEYKEALNFSNYVEWKYKDSQSGEYVDFPLKISFQIETVYQKNQKHLLLVEMQIHEKREKYSIDLNLMNMTNLRDKTVNVIFRKPKTDSSIEDLPYSWEDMGGTFAKTVLVQLNSTEYQEVLSKFKDSGSFKNVVKLERIQNPTSYKQFQAQKRKVEDRMKNNGSTLPVTRNLFHGTSPDVCENIYKDGFDRSHAGKNATAYGKGVYFATTSQYSHGYAKPDKEGLRRMFYADVITGEFCQGNSSYVTPPLIPGSTTQRYDSVVNNVNNPSMFVVFKDASVYPSYMLTYR